jgi:predicted nucleotide-binding protein (sugar kinase/HSP70/actin superfamily)/intein/homing endonuclease
MIITFPYWGNYTIAFKSFLEKLNLKVIPPKKTNPQTIEEGVKISPELYCFPLKVNLGNYLQALKEGADTIFMVTSLGGSCRLRYYGQIQEKALTEAGHRVNFVIFGQHPKDIYFKIKEISGASFFQILKAALFFYKKLRLIENLEKKAQYLRPREIEIGKTDQILDWAFFELDKIKDFRELSNFQKKVFQKISEIKIDKKKAVPKVALIGEIFTVCDHAINFDLEKKLGRAGIEVQREMNISYHLKKNIFPWKDWLIQKKIKPYLKSTVGGHGRDAIYEMLKAIEKKFAGVIQLLPFGCFLKDTKITVENYLQKPIQDIKIGEKVLTHKGRFKEVIQTFCQNYKGKILKIDCGGKLLTISLTPEHPILLAKTSIKGQKKEIQSFSFLPAIKAKKGDFLAIPIPKEVNNLRYFKWNKKYLRKPKWKDIKKFPYTPDLLRMIGYWLAEGTICYENYKYDKEGNKKYIRGISFHFGSQEREYIQDIINIIKKNFKTRISQYYRTDRNTCMELYIGNRSLGEIMLSLCGEHCDKKILHKDLTLLKPNSQKEIIKGFFRGDGCFRDEYGETTYRGVTTSQNLASQLFWLLIRNRIKPSLIEQYIKNRKLSYMIKIANAEGIKRLNDELIKVTDRKNYIRFRELENYFLVPIEKIEMVDFEGKVYTLSVKDDHSYVANFLTAQNCMPEVSVRPILEKIHQESGIPFLSLSLDEQVAEAGINTRIEAFCDVVKNYYNQRISNQLRIYE